ncbi:MAG: heme peroxidase [Chloroflexota bacterium]|nr:heme peroxidase [Chloroflexota bacterium]
MTTANVPSRPATTGRVNTRRYRRRQSGLSKLFRRAAIAVDQAVGWDKLPLPLAALVLIGLRNVYRWENLYDTNALPTVEQPEPVAEGTRHLTARTADGTYNDLEEPRMGAAGTRFGRNIPLRYAYQDPAMLEPNPRLISRELLTRERFTPATTLNVLAAAWLQFMIRDWFSHGRGDIQQAWEIPLRDDDPWPQHPMLVPRLQADPTRPSGSDGPLTFLNTETPWWDGSQLYGSTRELQQAVRLGEHGKLRLEDGMIPRQLLLQLGHEPGWWVGLALFQTVFAREHNAICDRLRATYPSWSDDDLFDRARLINSALLAKIHTVEWTPAVISHPTTIYALRANWWGIFQERLTKLLGRTSLDLLTGIPGSPTEHHAAPYSLTEEFTAVYRMHPLIPDDYRFRAAAGDRPIMERTFREIAGPNTVEVLDKVSPADLAWSFGTEYAGAIELHNFPRFLQEFERPDGKLQDLAATDILRIRELGVPRYNQFRRLMHLKPARTFEELTDNSTWAEELRRIYGDVERVDLMVGMFAERKPYGFGFSDTAFRIFILMASRRLKSDRFLTVDYTPRVYTPEGIAWVENTDMTTVFARHYPELIPMLRRVDNAFAPWRR